MAIEQCTAKDPATCRYHGNRQLGVKAAEYIANALTEKPRRYYLTDDELQTTPLKRMSATALALSLHNFAQAHPELDATHIASAINMAAHLHRKDLRSNRGRYPKTPYIEHPLRNTVRLIRFGCTDEATLITSLLHDTVEDHPFEISKEYAGKPTKDEYEARVNAFAYITETYGAEVAQLVKGMSNEIIARDASITEKNASYVHHVTAAIEQPKVCAAKVADLIDNAVGLYHNVSGTMKPEAISRRAAKYLLVWDNVERRLQRDVFEQRIPVSTEGLQEMLGQLQRGRTSLQRLSQLAVNTTA